MANNLFNLFNKNPMGNLSQQMQALKANPMQFLLEKRLNIPPEIQNDPRAIAQHLLNTGQMSQDQMNQLQNYINTRMPSF